MSQFKADLLAVLLCFVTFPFGVLGQVWCLIVSIPDLCLFLFLLSELFISYG